MSTRGGSSPDYSHRFMVTGPANVWDWDALTQIVHQSFRKFIPLTCSIIFNRIDEVDVGVIIIVGLRDKRPQLFNSNVESTYVSAASHEVEQAIREFFSSTLTNLSG